MFRIADLLSLAAAIVIAPIAMAQTIDTVPPVPPAPPADPAVITGPPPACELHIWPASRVVAQTSGAGAGFGLIGALIDMSAHAAQNKRDQAFVTSALDPKAQAKALREIDLPTLLHLPPVNVVMHDQGIELKSDDTNRLSDSKAQCYYEFVVRGLTYLKTSAHAPQMRTFLSIRGFDGAKITTDFRDSKHGNLEMRLPKEGEDSGPATDALIGAFKFDVDFFATKYLKKKK